MSATIKAQTASITAKLSALARAKAMPYDRLLTIFFIERAATRLVADPYLAEHLIFKGGYVNVRVYESPSLFRRNDRRRKTPRFDSERRRQFALQGRI